MANAEGTRVVLEPRTASSVVASSTLPAVLVEAAGTSCCTKAVVAMRVVLVPADAVGAAGVPVKVGEARFALRLSAVVTKAVVASCVVEVPAVAVGAAGVPVKVGEARGAAPETSATAKVTAPVLPATEVTGAVVRYPWALTKAVVAMDVSLSDRLGVTD